MEKHNRFILLTFLTFLVISASSCMKDDDSEKRANEKRLIENYVQVNNISVSPTTSGMYFIPQVEGTGATPSETDFALIKYKVTDLDGKFYDGTDRALADLNKVYPYFALGGPFKIYAGIGGFYKGVIEGLQMMKEGGKAQMIMPSVLAYDDFIPRIFEVELIKVINNPKAYEQEQIKNLLDTAYHMTLADSIPSSGIYYIEKLAGTGISPATDKKAKIKYKGYLPDGRVFDRTEGETTFTFTVGGTGNDRAIVGLDEGIRLMKKGGKATIVIPYYRGYGFKQTPNSNYQIIIPYFSTIVFDVELLDITD